jgi:hypothetical protein
MYRDDLAAAHARLQQLERELADASSQGTQDRQRIAALSSQLAAARDAITRMSQMPGAPPVPMGTYAPPQYMYPSRATTVLVLGILSLTVCGILGPIAWSMGNEELRRIDGSQTPPDSRGSAVAGRICGIIGSVLLIFAALWIVVMLCALLPTLNH